MKIACRYLPPVLLTALVLTALVAAPAAAQTPPRDAAQASASSSSELSIIASGWSALAAGRSDEALNAAERLLSKSPTNHHALGLKIEAQSHGAPVAALDTYERWLRGTRIEDVFLLAPIARGTLEQIAAGNDEALRIRALQKLAAHGDGRAASLLKQTSQTPGVTVVQLAMEGEAAAAQRLLDPKVAQKVQPQVLARALPAAGPAAVFALQALLKHPAAPVRMEAALSLGKLGAPEAIPDLKALFNDPEVRPYAAVALTRLGDSDGEPLVQELLQSPVMDMRLLGAQAYEGRGSGPWVQALMPALQDPNGLTRVRAAELLAPVAPESARPVLQEAAQDPNPVVRADVMRVIERTELFVPADSPLDSATSTEAGPAKGLSTLRLLLRDPEAATRLSAAAAILAIAAPR